MEAFFDNGLDLYNCNLRSCLDENILYSLTTKEVGRSAKNTVLKDANPVPGMPATVGVIHWKEKAIELYGTKKPCSELREVKGSFFKKRYFWRWAPTRKQYEVEYNEQESSLRYSISSFECLQVAYDGVEAATFYMPAQPKLFGKLKPSRVGVVPHALKEDEQFLIALLVYLEGRRQVQTVGVSLYLGSVLGSNNLQNVMIPPS
ncbi:hypothetical protein FISHEDRAFT_41878 [Fistulina hepatica ATCC 64428]|nr:hypothetical protein FISHEDRAFT_41878 [Fistulina hepatica ATCC 64428]